MFKKLFMSLMLVVSTTTFANSDWVVYDTATVITPDGAVLAKDLTEGHIISSKDKFGIHSAEVINVEKGRVRISEGIEVDVVKFTLIDFDIINIDNKWENVISANPPLSATDDVLEKKKFQTKYHNSFKFGKIARLILPLAVVSVMMPGADAGPGLAILCEASICPIFQGTACTTGFLWTVGAVGSLLSPLGLTPFALPLVTSICGSGAPGLVCMGSCAAVAGLLPCF